MTLFGAIARDQKRPDRVGDLGRECVPTSGRSPKRPTVRTSCHTPTPSSSSAWPRGLGCKSQGRRASMGTRIGTRATTVSTSRRISTGSGVELPLARSGNARSWDSTVIHATTGSRLRRRLHRQADKRGGKAFRGSAAEACGQPIPIESCDLRGRDPRLQHPGYRDLGYALAWHFRVNTGSRRRPRASVGRYDSDPDVGEHP